MRDHRFSSRIFDDFFRDFQNIVSRITTDAVAVGSVNVLQQGHRFFAEMRCRAVISDRTCRGQAGERAND